MMLKPSLARRASFSRQQQVLNGPLHTPHSFATPKKTHSPHRDCSHVRAVGQKGVASIRGVVRRGVQMSPSLLVVVAFTRRIISNNVIGTVAEVRTILEAAAAR